MICIYPGSFDPITNGHLDIIKRCSEMFDKVIVVILKNISKKPKFSLEQRIKMINAACKEIKGVEVDSFEGLTVNYARKRGAKVMVRGIRAISDYENESMLANVNQVIAPEIETIFLVTNSKWSYLSSSVVKEICNFNGDIKGMVPDCIIDEIKSAYTTNQSGEV